MQRALQNRIDRRDQRLHRVVKQVGEAQGSKDTKDRPSGLRPARSAKRVGSKVGSGDGTVGRGGQETQFHRSLPSRNCASQKRTKMQLPKLNGPLVSVQRFS